MIDQFNYFQRYKYIQIKRQQTRSSSSQEEVQKLVEKKLCKKIVFHAKTDNVPANYVTELYDNVNDLTNDCTG